MAATAKKGQNVYAPSRVYSYSRAATAEKLATPGTMRESSPRRRSSSSTKYAVPMRISVTGVLMIAAGR